MDLKSLTAEKIKGLIERGEASAVEICRAFQDRIGKQNPRFGPSFITTTISRSTRQSGSTE